MAVIENNSQGKECNREKPFDNPYDVFVECFRETLYPNFMDHQASAAYAIASKIILPLMKDSGESQIEQVLSIGCGTGEELYYLAAILNRDYPGMRFKGFDTSMTSIARAKNDTLTELKKRLKVLSAISGIPKRVLESTLATNNIEFTSEFPATAPTSLALFIGHTITHFVRQEDLWSILDRFRPKFIFVDFHENWDYALDSANRHKRHFDPKLWIESVKLRKCRHAAKKDCHRYPISPCVYHDSSKKPRLTVALATEALGDDCIRRGIAASWCDDDVKFLVETCQLRQSKQEIIASICKQCGYLPIDEIEYTSGYGRMQGTLLWKVEEEEEMVREALYRTMNEHMLPVLLRSAPGAANSRRQLSNLETQSLFHNFEAAIIAGVFGTDDYVCTAAYYDLQRIIERQSDTGKEKVPENGAPTPISHLIRNQSVNPSSFTYLKANSWLLVQPFSKVQQLLPTADGIYYSLLHSPSGVSLVPPSVEKRERMVPVDLFFARHESRLAKTNIKALTGRRSRIGTNELNGEWLGVPIYYGSFPLFQLYLRPNPATDLYKMGKSYWEALAKEMQRIFRRRFEEHVDTHFILPFMKKLFHLMNRDEEPLKGCDDCIRQFSAVFAQKLDRRDRMLDDHVCGLVETLITKSLEKPWKSWLSAFPEQDIKLLPEIENRNEHLKSRVIDMKKFFYASCERLKVSYWFEDIEFFSQDTTRAHTNVTFSHYQRLLARLFNKKNTAAIEENCREKKCLSPFQSKVKESMLRYNISPLYADWVSSRIAEMPFVEQGRKGGAWRPYSALKATFCRNLENTGDLWRYDGLALVSLLQIEFGATCTDDETAYVSRGENNYRPPVHKDICEMVIPVIKVLCGNMGKRIAKVELKEEDLERPGSQSFKVKADLTLVLDSNLGFLQSGDKAAAVKKALEGINASYQSNDCNIRFRYWVIGSRDGERTVEGVCVLDEEKTNAHE